MLLNVLSLLIQKTGGKSEEKDANIGAHSIRVDIKSIALDLCPRKTFVLVHPFCWGQLSVPNFEQEESGKKSGWRGLEEFLPQIFA